MASWGSIFSFRRRRGRLARPRSCVCRKAGSRTFSCGCVGPRPTANPCALTVGAWFAIRASDRQASRDGAASRVDQPEAFTRSEPGVALPLLPGPNVAWPNVRIEKKHRRINMRQIAALLRQLLLELPHQARQCRSLVAQCADDVRFRHRPAPLKYCRSEW